MDPFSLCLDCNKTAKVKVTNKNKNINYTYYLCKNCFKEIIYVKIALMKDVLIIIGEYNIN
jgi:protein-arginine kinase activator protein McsA